MRRSICILAAILGFATLKAQDRIFKKGGEVLKVKVTEVGIDDIGYKSVDEAEGPVYRLEKDRIVKIVYANGKVETYASNIRDREFYVGQKTGALKFSFLAPLFGHSQFTFERSKSPGRSIEFTASLIGAGKSTVIYTNYNNGVVVSDIRRNPLGLAVGVGYKFIRTPDFINRSIRMAHLLQGTYLKPVFYTGFYGENRMAYKNPNTNPVSERRNVAFAALMVEGGKQWVFSEDILFDAFVGLGYCADNLKRSSDPATTYYYEESEALHFNATRLGSSPGFALNAGIRIGLLIK